MTTKEKIKNFWDRNKKVIIFGAIASAVGTVLLLKPKKEEVDSESMVWKKDPDSTSEFPLEMPVSEIKEKLRSDDRTKELYDALIVVREDYNRMYVRNPE